MRSVFILAVLCVSAFATHQTVQPEPLQKSGTADFVTGFLMSMRLMEKMPDTFECVTKAATVKKLFDDFQAQFADHASAKVVIQFLVKFVPALEAAAPGCGAVANEAVDYVNEIKTIVTGNR